MIMYPGHYAVIRLDGDLQIEVVYTNDIEYHCRTLSDRNKRRVAEEPTNRNVSEPPRSHIGKSSYDWLESRNYSPEALAAGVKKHAEALRGLLMIACAT